MIKYIGKYGRGSGGIVDESMCFKKHEPVSIDFRGPLPHWEQLGTLQYVTFRLKDSIPQCLAKELAEMRRLWLAEHPKPWSEEEFTELTEIFDKKINLIESKGLGECVLGIPDCRDIFIEKLRRHDGDLYELFEFVVMPNHVHMIIMPGTDMYTILKTLKQYSARRINAILGRKGHLWQDDYFDRLLRSVKDYYKTANYIRQNPFPVNIDET